MRFCIVSLFALVAACAEAGVPFDAGVIDKSADGAPGVPDARDIPSGQNGSVCAGPSDCESGHCQNGFCCAAGDCCAQDVHCTAYAQAPTCDVVASCTGSRVEGSCNAAFQCEGVTVSDANACDDRTAGGTCSTGLSGPCGTGAPECQSGATMCVQTVFPTAESCGDGVDQDCNGFADDGCSCNPLAPAAGCGAGFHCLPTTTGATVCDSPIGAGTQYSTCTARSQCGAVYECVNTPFATTYCMQWCRVGFADCSVFDTCTSLAPAIFAGAQEYGVCYDGLP